MELNRNNSLARWAVEHVRPLVWSFWIFVVLMSISPLVSSSGSEDASLASDIVVIFTFFLFLLSMATVGAFVATRRPTNPLPWIMLFGSFWYAIAAFSDTYAALSREGGGYPGAGVLSLLSSVSWLVGLGVTATYLLLLYPDGKLKSRRWRPVAWASGTAIAGFVIGTAITPGDLQDIPGKVENPLGIEGAKPIGEFLSGVCFGAFAICMLLSIAAIVMRYFASRGETRQQMKWLAFAAFNILVAIAASAFLESRMGDSETAINFSNAIVTASIALIPLCIGVAVLKYRLYDIDVVINKTIVFGVLAVFITVVYVGIVVGIGSALGSSEKPNVALSIAATAIVAIAFSPVKERTQAITNRLVYGHRRSPYEVLADMSRTVSTAADPNDVLTGVAQAAAGGTAAEAAQVMLNLHDGTSVVRTFPDDSPEVEPTETFEVAHESELLGELAVQKKAGDPLTQHDRDLLVGLLAQAGLALHNARLTLELRARLEEISRQAEDLDSSRARIVSAADDSRRRLERDIAEGPRKDLEALSDRLLEARSKMDSDPEAAAVILEELAGEANVALDALRELARGLYPPLLADSGIVLALESHVRKRELPVEIHVSDATRESRFEQSIEATVYFCCVAALSEPAGTASIQLSSTTETVTTRLTGVTLDETVLRSIRDRVEAVGGDVLSEGPGAAGTLLIEIPAEAMQPVA